MFGIMFYFIYYDTGGWTPSSYFYGVLSGLSLSLSLLHLVIYIISLRRPILDYQVDMENETIKIPFSRKIQFKKIKLFANRENRSEVKVYYRTSVLNIILFHLKDDEGNELSYELSEKIGKYATKINHRVLYNYNILMILIVIGINLLFVLIQDRFPIIHQTYKYFIVFGISLLFVGLFTGVHSLILNRMYINNKNEKIE
jgi:hypothetical protein